MLNAVASVARSATSRSSLHSMRKTRWPWLRMTSTRCKCFLLSGRSFHSSCNFVSQQTSFLRTQDRHSFVMKVPFVVVDIGGLFARKRMRRSPSSIAWLASIPSLCRLQRSKPKLRRLPTSPSLCSQRRSPRTLCRPLLPIIYRGVVTSTKWRISTNDLQGRILEKRCCIIWEGCPHI